MTMSEDNVLNVEDSDSSDDDVMSDSSSSSSSTSSSSSSSDGEEETDLNGVEGEGDRITSVDMNDAEVAEYVARRRLAEDAVERKKAAMEKVVGKKQMKKPPTVAMQDPKKVIDN